MIASWMLYALLVSALIAAAAWVLEEVCRLIHLPVRFVWLGALLATLGLVALAPLRTAPPQETTLPAWVTPQGAVGAADRRGPGLLSSLGEMLAAGKTAFARPLRTAASLGEGAPGRALVAGWAALSLGLLSLVAATLLRSHGVRRSWPLREIAGTPVRVAPKAGPAVLGIHRPEVVIPEWLLEASPEEQRLVVLHEREHIRAGDPLVLAAGYLQVALIPWNPFAWWMLLRLRLSVELDCDVRVLRAGIRPQMYGSLLIDMAGRGPGLSLGAPALAGSPSTLERRLRAMTTRSPRFAALRAGALGTLGVATLVAACETRMPTSPEIERMDVAAAETQAKKFEIVSENGNVSYFVDGKQVSAEEARALGGDKIARMEMIRAEAGQGARFHIVTRDGAPGDRDHLRIAGEMTGKPGDGTHTRIMVREANPDGTHSIGTPRNFDGLLFVDGVLTPSTQLQSVNPNDIAKIEVIKGAAAAQAHSDPKAANGVIRITTKAGATKP